MRHGLRPVTSTALGSVPDSRAGAASGTNNAVARTGRLLALLLLRSADVTQADNADDAPTTEPGDDRTVHRHACPVDGHLTSIGSHPSDSPDDVEAIA